jgi:hypothetical protein
MVVGGIVGNELVRAPVATVDLKGCKNGLLTAARAGAAMAGQPR